MKTKRNSIILTIQIALICLIQLPVNTASIIETTNFIHHYDNTEQQKVSYSYLSPVSEFMNLPPDSDTYRYKKSTNDKSYFYSASILRTTIADCEIFADITHPERSLNN